MGKLGISLIAASFLLASSFGFFAAKAIGQAAPPTKTVTITLHDGATGPTGPAGPAGPAGPPGPKGGSGTIECPANFVIGDVVINHPGGQVTIYGCIKEG